MSNVLTWVQVAAVAKTAGWALQAATTAVSITMPESGRDAAIIQQGVPYSQQGWGLWQITPGNSEPQFGIDNQLLDPLNNARAALAKYQGDGDSFQPWTTWAHGLNAPYIDVAAQAVGLVWALTATQVAGLVATARSGGTLTPAAPPQVADWSAYVNHAAGTARGRANRYAGAAARLAALRGKYPPPIVTVPNPGTVVQPVRRVHGR